MTPSSSSFDARLTAYRDRVEPRLEAVLPDENAPPAELHAAMRYALLGGGKRVRPLLIYATGEALDIPVERLDLPACAVEIVHAYSLVHDDLPAMDDDDLRRGRPTCHRKFGEATAILAGDALQALAFEVLAKDAATGTGAAMTLCLARACGSGGMAGGQAMDLAAVGQGLNVEQLENMHQRKTGALIQASVMLATLQNAGLDEDTARGLGDFGALLGLAFQIRDDVLDVQGDTDTLGKVAGSDEARDKPTYPAAVGLEAAQDRAEALLDDALSSIDTLPASADLLRYLARYIVARDR